MSNESFRKGEVGMTGSLRVAIVGVSAEHGWALESHVPAIRAVPGLELVAVGNPSERGAAGAAAAFGVSRAYTSMADLLADGDVDLVSVTAPVPEHAALVGA